MDVYAERIGEVGEYAGEVGEYAGEVGEYAGEVGEYAGEVGEYAGEVGEYAGEVGSDTKLAKGRDEVGTLGMTSSITAFALAFERPEGSRKTRVVPQIRSISCRSFTLTVPRSTGLSLIHSGQFVSVR